MVNETKSISLEMINHCLKYSLVKPEKTKHFIEANAVYLSYFFITLQHMAEMPEFPDYVHENRLGRLLTANILENFITGSKGPVYCQYYGQIKA